MIKLDNFVHTISDVLKIKQPTIKFDSSVFQSETQLAMADILNNIIYITPFAQLNPDILFAISHELRHMWQFQDKHWLPILKQHQHSNIFNIDDYNNQPEEIDAHAFAALVMIDMFRVEPLFDGLDSTTIERIYKRAEEIAISMSSQTSL